MEQSDINGIPDFTLLTGSSSGIGREMAIHLSGDHRLILHGRDGTRLEETRRACERPDSHLVWRYDLRHVDALSESLSDFLAFHSIQVRGFVHCAAVLPLLPLRSMSAEKFRETFDVNFFSAVELVACLTRKKVNASHLRSVVFISSIASTFGARGISAYCASKGALDSLMRALAVELAPGVRVNSVLPGGLRTEMTRNIFEDPEMVAKFERDYPLGIGEAADVVNAVAFLLCDKARWVTGHQFVVDGGRTANITA